MELVPGLMLLAATSALSAYMKLGKTRWFAVTVQRTPSWMLGCVTGLLLAALTLLFGGGGKAAFVAAVCGGVLAEWIVGADRQNAPAELGHTERDVGQLH